MGIETALARNRIVSTILASIRCSALNDARGECDGAHIAGA